MRFRSHTKMPSKIAFPMTPMIDIVFQLLVFFLLNLKFVTPEGNVNLNLPIKITGFSKVAQEPADIRVSLRSDRYGKLTQILLGSKDLGADDIAFDRLNAEILSIVGRPGNPLTKDIEVEIDADFETQYKDVVRAISQCTGRFDPETNQIARYVEKIKFAPPHKPKG